MMSILKCHFLCIALIFHIFHYLSVPRLIAENEFPIVWQYQGGLLKPESIIYDKTSGFIFVSNMVDEGRAAIKKAGKNLGKADYTGPGFVSKFTLDGQLVKLKWVTGFASPKGMRISGNLLWMSDIERLIAIDIKQGMVVKSIHVKGARFNDVAMNQRDGTIYVSEMMQGAIYHFKNEKLSKFMTGPELDYALVVHEGVLYLAGSGQRPRTPTSKEGHLVAVDLMTKKIRKVTQPVGSLDTVESDGRDGFFLTDWRKGNVIHVNKLGQTKVIISHEAGTADATFLVDRNWLLLPVIPENRIIVYDLSKLFD